MQDSDPHLIYRTMDNPVRILFWAASDFACVAVPILFGMMIGSVKLMLAVLLLKPLWTKLLKRAPRGTIIHKLYWHMSVAKFLKIKHLPPSYIREIVL